MSAEGGAKIITGSLGGGKSLAAVGLIMDHLSKGGTVVTNVAVYPEKIAVWMKEEFGLIYDPERLKILNAASIRDFQDMAVRGTREQTALMVLDEAALDVAARDWATLADETFNFVILVRKLCIDLVLIAQDANDVDKRIRQKMQEEIHCRSLKNFLGDWFDLPIFIRVRYTLSVGKKPWRRGAKWEWKGEGWGYFNSHALHGAKAEHFQALEAAKEGDLERVTYNPVPYYALCVFTAFTSAVSTCLFVN